MDEIVRLLESAQVHLTLPDPLDELAKSVNLSGSRLRHIFKAETGLSPVPFVMNLRLKRAKKLLETSYLSVKEVAAEIGISNDSYFVRTFKNAHGVTPGYYRSHIVATTPETPNRWERSQKSQKVAM